MIFSLGFFSFGIIIGKKLSDEIYEKKLVEFSKKAELSIKSRDLYKNKESVKISERLIEKERKSIAKESSIPKLSFREDKEPPKKITRSFSPPPSRKILEKPKKVTSDKFFSFQIGAHASKDQASKHVNFYKKKGYTSFYSKASVNKKTWFRVFVGLFESRKDALRFRKKASKYLPEFKKSILKIAPVERSVL